ncbi:hypothetical protein DV737_g5188, partial [Chaetothyriales sp. CBS 132003]
MAVLPVPDEVVSLDLTERTDFSIFLRYPDIDFDPEAPQMDGPGPAIDFSSPVSHAAGNLLSLRPEGPFSSPASDQEGNDDTDLASRSASTPHTIPSPLAVQDRESNRPGEYQEFLHKVEVADLPETAVHYFRSLAGQMLQMAVLLQPKSFYLSATADQDIVGCSDALLAQLCASNKIVSGQISAIHYITSLAPFTVTPTDLALPSIFYQRASLIVAHLTLPCRRSFNLLSALLAVFDAYIYSPYLHLSQHRHHFSSACAERINALYNALQTLIASYSQWMRTLRGLKCTYMSPLLGQIKDSTKVQAEIADRKAALLACDEMNARPLSDVMTDQVEEDQLRGVERLAERRRTKSSTLVRETKTRMVGVRDRGGLQGMV